MKLNLNFPVKALDGQDIQGSNLGKILAEVMVRNSKGDSIKIYDWALKLYNGQDIDIEDDEAEFKKLVEANEEMTILVKSQILKAIG